MSRLSKIGAAALAAFGWTAGSSAVTANYLVVAGGGSGGSSGSGFGDSAGGGAGGMLTGTTSLSLTQSYIITIGSGGAVAGYDTVGNNGGDSSISTVSVTATGGGGGGAGSKKSGSAGGSSGGSVQDTTPLSATSGQGSNGGQGWGNGPYYGAGGGGGKGGVGGAGSSTVAGNGGAGTASSITGSSVTYAGGGGGGTYNGGTPGTGGSGGGGNGNTNNGVGGNGTANLGGGGGGTGGSSGSGTNSYGGQGGSGIVIISYPGVQKFGGGVVTTDGTNTVHTFTTSGTLQPINLLSAQYLIVAGGAGSAAYGGGGGAGGLLSGTGLTIDTNSTYLVTVGSGGTGVAGAAGNNGTNSTFSLVSTAAAGGGYGSYGGTAAAAGGSGGGGGNSSPYFAGGNGTAGQGNAGGSGAFGGGTGYTSGGGGGAGAVGANGNGSTQSGNGGIGVSSSISGTATYYAGGGGGGGYSPYGVSAGTGGSGGGGNGAATAGAAGTSATVNTGGGGGGGAGGGGTGGNGGSGVVIIAYPGSVQQMAGGTVTIAGGNVIHTFTSTGYLAPIKLVSNSLRFRASNSAYLSRTPTVASNRTTWTWSGWVKRGVLGATVQNIFSTNYNSGGNGSGFEMRFDDGSTDQLKIADLISGSVPTTLITSQVFRDPAAWYHIVLAYDTTQATASNRLKLYVNGVQVTAFGTATYPSQNFAGQVNSTVTHYVGAWANAGSPGRYYDGYMAEVNFVDGQALTPNSFGTYNSYGVWQPIAYGGSYGTNGYYLPFNYPVVAASSVGVSTFYLLVAGGGGGGGNGGAGGGAGGFLTSTTTLSTGTSYVVTVGAGGTGGTNSNGTNGGDSSIAGLTAAVGGGYGAWYSNTGGNGGSGGGGGQLEPGSLAGGTGTAGQGNNGGGGGSGGAGGGGGASQAGATKSAPNGGNGGNGTASSITGSSVTYAGGGGGGASNGTPGSGGSGGGGAGAPYLGGNATAGTVNTGGGGGGSWSSVGGAGGSGIVVISYPAPQRFSGGTVTTSGSNVIHTFTSSGILYNSIAADYSPQQNNWTANNISTTPGVTYDSMTDVPTLTSATQANYPTLNPLKVFLGGAAQIFTYSNGCLTVSDSSSNSVNSTATMAFPPTGKFYFECTMTAVAAASSNNIGVIDYSQYGGNGPFQNYGSYRSNGTISNLAGTGQTSGATYTSGDIIGVAVDITNGTCQFYKNNVAQGATPSFTFTAGTQLWAYVYGDNQAGTKTFNINFGQRPFAYTPPSGYVALNTYNL